MCRIFTENAVHWSLASLAISLASCGGDSPMGTDRPETKDHFREMTPESRMESTVVYEYLPGPGQFINDAAGMGVIATQQEANEWARKRLESNLFVSLGAFGGYIVVGFDHSIKASGNGYDFAILGNAYLNPLGTGGSNEPGIVYVMQDSNGNGLPDDEWYELKGSETEGIIRYYEVTYHRPDSPKSDVTWTDNRGGSGTVKHLGAFHRQDSYYPAWIKADSYSLKGTCLTSRTGQDGSGLWTSAPFGWGYADNMGSDNLESIFHENAATDKSSDTAQRNGFSIRNAMRADGTPANLEYIDFIKVQTGVNAKSGILGEVSTEVCGFIDL